MKNILYAVLLFLPYISFSQPVNNTTYNELLFNKRSGLLEIVTILDFNNLEQDTICFRAAKWFDSKLMRLNEDKFNVRVAYKDMRDGKVVGRYNDKYDIKRKSKKKSLNISCKIEILVKGNKARVTATSFILPEYGFIPLESVVLNDDNNFSKYYLRLKDNLTSQIIYLNGNLQNWVENYTYIITLDEDW